MIIYLARHCESEYNVRKLLNSDPSVKVALTSKGLHQAKSLAESLKSADLETIYVSELYRTQQTAEIINAYHNKPIVVEPRLNDNKSGFEGKSVDEYIKAIESSDNGLKAKFGDGESLEEVLDRVRRFVNELKELNNETSLIVTSGYIVECLYGISAKVPPDAASSFEIPQGEYHKLLI